MLSKHLFVVKKERKEKKGLKELEESQFLKKGVNENFALEFLYCTFHYISRALGGPFFINRELKILKIKTQKSILDSV